jgi:hypothetical protein
VHHTPDTADIIDAFCSLQYHVLRFSKVFWKLRKTLQTGPSVARLISAAVLSQDSSVPADGIPVSARNRKTAACR